MADRVAMWHIVNRGRSSQEVRTCLQDRVLTPVPSVSPRKLELPLPIAMAPNPSGVVATYPKLNNLQYRSLAVPSSSFLVPRWFLAG